MDCNAQVQAYGPHAGDAALVAARKGPLELREVHFSYPLRQDAPGMFASPVLHCASLASACTLRSASCQNTTYITPLQSTLLLVVLFCVKL